jgi:hypothetical protein
MKYFSLITLFICSFCLISCDGGLSREKAKKMIIEKDKLPEDIIESFGLTYRDFYKTPWFNAPEMLKIYEALKDEGLVKFDFKGFHSKFECWLTEKGSQYLVSDIFYSELGNAIIKVKVAKLEFGEITGIAEMNGLNFVDVEYTVIYSDITPFGRIAYH